mmetsp:Transcript_9735/g.18459  ORF Transcript_9735/g.18459 Transcript_9735/m.18459 type:complete len:89 (+) Transcript_9735:1332-1598(+)
MTSSSLVNADACTFSPPIPLFFSMPTGGRFLSSPPDSDTVITGREDGKFGMNKSVEEGDDNGPVINIIQNGFCRVANWKKTLFEYNWF